METPTQRVGRPAGQENPVIKQVRLGTQDAEELSLLAREWRCSEAAAIRRAIHEKAHEAGAVARRRVTKAQLRRAAEAAREYYATDSEAREWMEFAGDQPSYDRG